MCRGKLRQPRQQDLVAQVAGAVVTAEAYQRAVKVQGEESLAS